METNMAPLDRIFRLIVALGIVALIFFYTMSAAIGIGLVIIAGELFVTSIFGFSPLYALLDFKTSR